MDKMDFMIAVLESFELAESEESIDCMAGQMMDIVANQAEPSKQYLRAGILN